MSVLSHQASNPSHTHSDVILFMYCHPKGFWPCAQCSVYLNCNEPEQISHCYEPALLSRHACGCCLVAATEF